MREADCILHVIDPTSSNSESQVEAVEATLEEIGVHDVPVIKVFNKIDLLPEKEELLEKNNPANGQFIYVSAKTEDGIQSLKELLRALLFKNLELFYLSIPQSKRELVKSFSKWTMILKKRENGDQIELKIVADPRSIINYLPYLKRGEKNW